MNNAFDEAKSLFFDFVESFGLSDADFPEDQPQDRQCEFEQKFRELICKYDGHQVIPDQCGKVEHDYCVVCDERRDHLTGKIGRDCRE